MFRRYQSSASIEFIPICCATMLYHLGQTSSSYVAIPFIPRGSAVPERFGQNELPAGRNEERTMKKPSFVPSSGFNRCNL